MLIATLSIAGIKLCCKLFLFLRGILALIYIQYRDLTNVPALATNPNVRHQVRRLMMTCYRRHIRQLSYRGLKRKLWNGKELSEEIVLSPWSTRTVRGPNWNIFGDRHSDDGSGDR